MLPDLLQINSHLHDLLSSRILTPADFALMHVLTRWATDHGGNEAVISLQILCERSGLSDSTVRRRLPALQKKGLITISKSELRPDPISKPVNRYVLNFRDFAAIAGNTHIKYSDWYVDGDTCFPIFQGYSFTGGGFVKAHEFTCRDGSTAILTMVNGARLSFPADLREILREVIAVNGGIKLQDWELGIIFNQVRGISLKELDWILAKLSNRRPRVPHGSYYTHVFQKLMTVPAEKRELKARKRPRAADDEKPSKFAYRRSEGTTYADHLLNEARKLKPTGRIPETKEYMTALFRGASEKRREDFQDWVLAGCPPDRDMV